MGELVLRFLFGKFVKSITSQVKTSSKVKIETSCLIDYRDARAVKSCEPKRSQNASQGIKKAPYKYRLCKSQGQGQRRSTNENGG